MSNTPQGGAIEGNAADDALMVDQGHDEEQTSQAKDHHPANFRGIER